MHFPNSKHLESIINMSYYVKASTAYVKSLRILELFRMYVSRVPFEAREVQYLARHCNGEHRYWMLIEAGVQYQSSYSDQDYDLLIKVGGKAARPKLERMKSTSRFR